MTSEVTPASRHWQTIRSITVRCDDTSSDTVTSGEKSITHGIYRTTKIVSSKAIKSVTHNFHSGQYLVLYEDGNLEIFLKDGSCERVHPREKLDGLVYASSTKLYVTWDKFGTIKLMTQSFTLVNTVPSPGHIHTMLYNEFKNEVVSTSLGMIHVWMFRMNNTLLVPKLSITGDLEQGSGINKIALEPTSSKLQRLFVAIKNGVHIYRLSDGQCVTQMLDLHKRDIIDLLFYQTSQILLTAAADGSIKLWDSPCTLRAVFVGHTKAVNCLSAYQKGPLILSGSTDRALRLWNIDANEEVQCIETGQPIYGICKKFGETDFFTFNTNSVSFWKINNVYTIFTVIGSKANVLKTTANPTMAQLCYYLCDDACIRFVCPKNGNVVCVMMSPNWKRIKDAVCVPNLDMVFVLLRDGIILKCSTNTNPCKVEETWTTDQTGSESDCTVLCLFEHILEDKLVGDKWIDLVTETEFQAANERETTSRKSLTKKKDRTLLIGGCADGKLVVYNWNGSKRSGGVSFSIEAHRSAIVALADNSTLNQIASCDSDRIVRIWRVFPFAEDALAPLMFILNNEPATHLVYSRHRLCMALQDPSTATYNLTMFKTTDTEPVRIEHSTVDDHQDTITAVCSCPKLSIFASASVDGTIKIWDGNNKIIRVVKLQSKPSGLCFSTEEGDLLVGMGENVHRIPFEKYLPEKYLKQKVAMQINEPGDIESIRVDERILAALDVDEKHRLQKARSSELLLAKFVDIIPLEELEARKQEENEKNRAVSILVKRDEDLERIQKGKPLAKKKPISKRAVREEAWKRYLDLFYSRKPIPAIGSSEDHEDEDESSYKPENTRDQFIPDRGNTGFFSISSGVTDIRKMTSKLKEKDNDDNRAGIKLFKKERSLSNSSESEPSRKDFARPLSVGLRPEFHSNGPYATLRRILSAPPKFRVFTDDREAITRDLPKAKALRPIYVEPASDFPSCSETLRSLNRKITVDADSRQESFNLSRKERGILPVAPDGYLPNSVVVALYKELKKENVAVEEQEWQPKELTQQQLDELEEHKRGKKKACDEEEDQDLKPDSSDHSWSRIFEKFNILSESSSSDREIDIDTPPISPPPPPPHEEAKEESPEPPVKSKEIKPLKPIEKLIARPIVEKTPTPPPHEPTPPPPPIPQTPLPRFITQFKGQAWFDKFFPNASSEMFPKPSTIEGFFQLLLNLLKKENGYEMKTQLLAAMLTLRRQQQQQFGMETTQMAEVTLLGQLNIPVDISSDERNERKSHFTKLCLTLLASLSLFSESFITELMAQCITADMNQRHYSFHLLQENGLQDPHSYFARELNTFTTYGVFDIFEKKQAVKKQCSKWLHKWMQLFRDHIVSLSGKIYRAKKGNVVRGTKSPKANMKGILKKEEKEQSFESGNRRISFIPNEFVNDAAHNISPIDAINYFCEIQFEDQLKKAREASVAPAEETAKSDRLRNTVVLLPKIDGYHSLARLGETHQSCCHPERETPLAYGTRLPRLRQDNFERGLQLRLNTLTLNPFPNLLDELLYEPFANSQLVTLRSAPKYFVPSHSYVDNIQI